MKERLLDVIKWGLILIIAGTVLYVILPKYELVPSNIVRLNKITGHVEVFNPADGEWIGK